jgi:MSHA biogenesis protein MshM
MLCYGEGKQMVDTTHVNGAARDTVAQKRRLWPWLAGAGALAGMAAGLAWTFVR